MTSSRWQKSSFSAAHDDCVEVRTVQTLVQLRESDDGDVILRATTTAVTALLDAIKAGELDHHA
ncbi:DUF397 domain-containing protein [Kitasatospora purpeofusca]|uniref:DUF397 domain-containing protein n=1 Tax=Kitasatospora purpeofusca TaxID=67352 RepID=UPI00386EE4B5|nr:DUF397 domain-containing protein [Kitasatospora purpeofusca]